MKMEEQQWESSLAGLAAAALLALSSLAAPGCNRQCHETTGPAANLPGASEHRRAEAVNGAAESGLRAYIDPETGEFTTPPRDGKPSGKQQAPNPATSTSSQGLKPEPAPGGGVMIDLKGRFQQNSTSGPKPAPAKPESDKER